MVAPPGPAMTERPTYSKISYWSVAAMFSPTGQTNSSPKNSVSYISLAPAKSVFDSEAQSVRVAAMGLVAPNLSQPSK